MKIRFIRISILFSVWVSFNFSQSDNIVYKPSLSIGAGYTKIEGIATTAVPASYFLR